MTNIRLLIAADSGTGKTGAVWSLVEAGYNVRIADFDNGCDFLKIKMAEKLATLPEAEREAFKQRLSIQTLRDRIRSVGDSITLETPTAYERFIRILGNWPGVGKGLDCWTSRDVFVLDTLNFFCRAVLYRLQNVNGSLNKRVQPQDYMHVQNDIKAIMDRVISDQYKCAIIINTHLDYKEYREGTFFPVGMLERDTTGTDEKKVSTAETDVRATPTTFGAKLGPQIGGYFNFQFTCRTRIVGSKPKRVFRTVPDAVVDCKCPFTGLPDELPLETGLATVLKRWEELGLNN